MVDVAREFQISDRAMAKICSKRQAPVPPRGYWAKKIAGKEPAKVPLPEFVTAPPKDRKPTIRSAQQTPEKTQIRSPSLERQLTIKKALKEFRKPLSEAPDYTVRTPGGVIGIGLTSCQ
jgi:hypothetical protein